MKRDSTNVRDTDNKSIVVVDHTNLPAVKWARPLSYSADVCEALASWPQLEVFDVNVHHAKHFGTTDGRQFLYLPIGTDEYTIIEDLDGHFGDVDDQIERLNAALRAYSAGIAEVQS